jgi:DNA repair protein RecO (recombination protein O)
MLQKTKGIVLRSIKYGDTSLVCTLFTEVYGVQTYMVQGVRSSKTKNHRAGLLQPATLLDLIVYQQPQKNMQRIKEFQPAYIYQSLQEEIVKNSIALFSVELLLRLLPEHAPMPELYDFAHEYFRQLDVMPVNAVANFPLYFIIQCARMMGYDIGEDEATLAKGIGLIPGSISLHQEDINMLNALLQVEKMEELKNIPMNAETRFRLLDWYIEFLQQHTQHMGSIRSLTVLRAILH